MVELGAAERLRGERPARAVARTAGRILGRHDAHAERRERATQVLERTRARSHGDEPRARTRRDHVARGCHGEGGRRRRGRRSTRARGARLKPTHVRSQRAVASCREPATSRRHGALPVPINVACIVRSRREYLTEILDARVPMRHDHMFPFKDQCAGAARAVPGRDAGRVSSVAHHRCAHDPRAMLVVMNRRLASEPSRSPRRLVSRRSKAARRPVPRASRAAASGASPNPPPRTLPQYLRDRERRGTCQRDER